MQKESRAQRTHQTSCMLRRGDSGGCPQAFQHGQPCPHTHPTLTTVAVRPAAEELLPEVYTARGRKADTYLQASGGGRRPRRVGTQPAGCTARKREQHGWAQHIPVLWWGHLTLLQNVFAGKQGSHSRTIKSLPSQPCPARPGPLRPSLEHLRLGAGGVAHDRHIDVATQIDALHGRGLAGGQPPASLHARTRGLLTCHALFPATSAPPGTPLHACSPQSAAPPQPCVQGRLRAGAHAPP